MKYKVSPQKAYMQYAGDLAGYPDTPCSSCSEPVCWYSSAGKAEAQITGLCEPCFDFITWPGDEPRPSWMQFVKHKKEE